MQESGCRCSYILVLDQTCWIKYMSEWREKRGNHETVEGQDRIDSFRDVQDDEAEL